MRYRIGISSAAYDRWKLSPPPEPRMVTCPECDGYGRSMQQCPECSGTGSQCNHELGNSHEECGECSGRGKLMMRCETCNGRGEIVDEGRGMIDS